MSAPGTKADHLQSGDRRWLVTQSGLNRRSGQLLSGTGSKKVVVDKVPDHAEHIDHEEDSDDLRGNGAGPHLPPLRLRRRRHRQGMATARTGPRPRQDRGGAFRACDRVHHVPSARAAGFRRLPVTRAVLSSCRSSCRSLSPVKAFPSGGRSKTETFIDRLKNIILPHTAA